jgi:diguanylate cyclase (GGDEF)-like protein
VLPTRDPLTGILATPVLHEALAHEVASAERYGAPSLVVVDVVDYERWVETRGALRADLVMRGLAAMLRSSSRRSDILGLLAPGRMCLLLPRTPAARAQIVARRVRTHCTRLGTQETHLVVGLVSVPAPVVLEDVLGEVEGAMLEARTSQGLRVVTSTEP